MQTPAAYPAVIIKNTDMVISDNTYKICKTRCLHLCWRCTHTHHAYTHIHTSAHLVMLSKFILVAHFMHRCTCSKPVYVCMCVRTYIFMYVCLYAYKYVCRHTYVFMYVCLYAYKYVCMHTSSLLPTSCTDVLAANLCMYV